MFVFPVGMAAAAKSTDCNKHILLDLCRHVLALPLEVGSGSYDIRNGGDTYNPIDSAINHPIGQVTQALIDLWLKQKPNDKDQLPAELKLIFTNLCDMGVERFRHGRAVLALQLVTFFRVDRPWSEGHLLPLFSWDKPEAKAMWQGFLYSPRAYSPLLIAFKPQFLESANHYDDLGKLRWQFATFLTYLALGPTEGYTPEDFRSAIDALPPEGLEQSAQALFQFLEGAANQRENYWKNRIQPFWQQIWPKSRDSATPRIAASLTRLVIAAGGEFPAAFSVLQNWLQPLEHLGFAIELHQSGLCQRFPKDALQLLDTVIKNQPWAPQELSQCLDQIAQAAPNLKQDAKYLKLQDYLYRQRNK